MRRVYHGDPEEDDGVEIRASEVVVERGGTITYGEDYAESDLWKMVRVAPEEFLSPDREEEAEFALEKEPRYLWVLCPAGYSNLGKAEFSGVQNGRLSFVVETDHRTDYAHDIETIRGNRLERRETRG